VLINTLKGAPRLDVPDQFRPAFMAEVEKAYSEYFADSAAVEIADPSRVRSDFREVGVQLHAERTARPVPLRDGCLSLDNSGAAVVGRSERAMHDDDRFLTADFRIVLSARTLRSFIDSSLFHLRPTGIYRKAWRSRTGLTYLSMRFVLHQDMQAALPHRGLRGDQRRR
jgi:hypothetical protein